jgi:hypothetical protein
LLKNEFEIGSDECDHWCLRVRPLVDER